MRYISIKSREGKGEGMNRREFLRLSAAAGAAIAGGGILSACDLEDLALRGVRIVDPHAHPDQFYADNPSVIDASSTLATIVEIGMVASSFAAVGDLWYLNNPTLEDVAGNEYANVDRQLDKVEDLVAAGKVKLIRTVSDIPYALMTGVPPGAILSIEGGDPLTSGSVGADPQRFADDRIEEYYGRGVRIITLIHYHHNLLGECQAPKFPPEVDPAPSIPGLTPLGAHVVGRMMDRGILVDVAHAAGATVEGVAEIARGKNRPIIDSHTGLRPDAGESPSRRLRTFEEMARIAETGGVVCTWPFAWQTDAASRLTFADWAAEIRRMKNEIGMAHVGLGTDGGGGLPAMIEGYNGVQDLGKLALEMRKAGLSQQDVQAFFGGNLLRVLKACIG